MVRPTEVLFISNTMEEIGMVLVRSGTHILCGTAYLFSVFNPHSTPLYVKASTISSNIFERLLIANITPHNKSIFLSPTHTHKHTHTHTHKQLNTVRADMGNRKGQLVYEYKQTS